MDKQLVSILVPIYNGQKFLTEFLDSIKKQTYRPIELILRDDCSKDASVNLCEKWKENNAECDFTINLIKGEKNIGLSQNVAKLAQYARGKFIFLADQDDIWLKDKVLEQVEYLENNPECVVCLSDRSITDARLNVHIKSNYEYLGYNRTSMKMEEVVRHKYSYAANCMAVRNMNKQIFDIPDGITCHDSFIAYMASYYGTVDFLFEPLLLYRIHSHNLSGNFCAENSRNFLECFRRYLKSCKRGQESSRNDGRIICDEMKKRYGVDLAELESPFANCVKYNYIKRAWEEARKKYKADKIGKWSIPVIQK